MQQLIVSGYNDFLDAAATEYNGLGGGSVWTATAFNRQQLVSAPGTITTLAVKLDGVPGAGKSYTITLMKNGVAQLLEVIITGGAQTQGIDLAHPIAVVAGDYISLRCVPAGTPSVRRAQWCSIFQSTNARQSLILGTGITNSGGIVYVPLSHNYDVNDITENLAYQVIPTAGKIKNLYVLLSVDPGVAPDAYRFTMRKNGADQALTVTITADAISGNDIANEVVVAAGDLVNIKVEPLNVPAAQPQFNFGMTFEADIDGESILLGGSSDTPTLAATEYGFLAPGNTQWTWTATETSRQGLSLAGFTLRKFYAWMSGISANDYLLKVRKALADSGLAITITAGSQSGNDIVHTYAPVDYESLDISCLAAGTARHLHSGLVVYKSPGQFIQCNAVFDSG